MSRADTLKGHGLSMASEDYLESIYRITEIEGGIDGIRSVDVEEQLGVSKASVNKAISTLRESGMVEQSRYGRVTLTEEGKAYGAEIWRTHRALRVVLTEALGVDGETADAEACLMEHALSHDTRAKLIDYLKQQGIGFDD
jgi:Mn-dependent DtxR family transcriptional regulator